MNWLRLDSARRNANPLELDLIEHYAAGKVSRRDFVRRGTIIGLSAPMMGMVIAACGDDHAHHRGAEPDDGAAADEVTAADLARGVVLDQIELQRIGIAACAVESQPVHVGVPSCRPAGRYVTCGCGRNDRHADPG